MNKKVKIYFQVCHGVGASEQEAHIDAAYTSIKELGGLDS